MGSTQSATVQEVVNTIEQFGYYLATVFKFFVVIGIIAGVTILALAIWRQKKHLTSVHHYVVPKFFARPLSKTHT